MLLLFTPNLLQITPPSLLSNPFIIKPICIFINKYYSHMHEKKKQAKFLICYFSNTTKFFFLIPYLAAPLPSHSYKTSDTIRRTVRHETMSVSNRTSSPSNPHCDRSPSMRTTNYCNRRHRSRNVFSRQ